MSKLERKGPTKPVEVGGVEFIATTMSHDPKKLGLQIKRLLDFEPNHFAVYPIEWIGEIPPNIVSWATVANGRPYFATCVNTIYDLYESIDAQTREDPKNCGPIAAGVYQNMEDFLLQADYLDRFLSINSSEVVFDNFDQIIEVSRRKRKEYNDYKYKLPQSNVKL